MNGKEDKIDTLDRATAWLERTGELTLDDLRAARKQMGYEVESSEHEFLDFVGKLRTVTATAPFAIVSRGKQLKFDNVGLANATELSVPLIMKLDRRLIRFSSIPEVVLRKIGEVLQTPIELVSVYLQQKPIFAAGASFRADQAPTLPEPQDFFDAVSEDLTISDARKQVLLKLKG